MSIIIDLPDDILQRLREECADLNAQAKENMLVEWYRQNNISHHELGVALGLDRFQTDGLLKKHNVTEDLITKEEYDADLERLRQLLNR
jgi:hypothetical protein